MKTRRKNSTPQILITAFLAVVFFQIATNHLNSTSTPGEYQSHTNVVISPAILTMLYAGDNFLAANLEAIRAAAIGPSEEEDLNDFRIRAHSNISILNACHEDNVYLANAMLSWSGSVDTSNKILDRATECRFWDDIPPFLLGFNQYFFNKNVKDARNYLEIAASRNIQNQANLKKISIMMATRSLNDLNMAIAYLRNEHDKSNDNKLRKLLNRRLVRLEGLQILREAQSKYEKLRASPLKDPNDLLASNILEQFPNDPTGIGYEFKDNTFKLRSLKIGGLEKY